MTPRFTAHLLRALPALACLLAAPARAAGGAAPQAPHLDTLLSDWRAAHGESWYLRTDVETGYLEMLYGGNVPPSTVPTDDASFEALGRAALQSTAAMHGIDAETLVHERTEFLPLGQIGSTDKETVRFREAVGGVRVVGGYVNVLFSARGALLSVQSTGQPHLAGFDTSPTVTPRGAAAIAAATFETRNGVAPTLVGSPELVVDQIRDGGHRTPALAYLVNAQWIVDGSDPIGWRYSIDARTGAVLRQERSIHFDVTGTVTSMASPGLSPDEASNPPAAQVMKYLRCTSSAGTVYTDANGNFNFAGVNAPLAVTFQFSSGQRANVSNQNGTNYSMVATLQPNQANSVLLNPSPTGTVTAQANGLMFIERTSALIHSIMPTDTHADFSALTKVNENSTCNAYYDGSSTNFFLTGGGCPNTCYSTVVNHEFGHWMNDLYGTGNGPDGMGEGNADTWSEYIYDTPIIAQDFFGPGTILRNGNNSRHFCGDCCGGCYGEVHTDGEVWMGAAWKVRHNLENTNGQAAGGLIASTLFLGWMNGYNQTQIRSIIETQWLTLDDNDGNLNDGTPHFSDIDSAFRAQGFPGVTLSCQTPTNYCVTSPNSMNPAGARMTYGGTTFVAENNFIVLAYGLPPQKPGIFFYGQNQTSVPFGNGTRCVANPFFRLPIRISNSFGDLEFDLDLNALPAGGQISGGQTWNFQAYYRDPAAGGANFNATDGLNTLWCQ
jgi:hypothetical protein